MTTLPGSSEGDDNSNFKASDSEVVEFKYTGASLSNGAGNIGRAGGGGRKDGLVELADVLASIKRSIVKVGRSLDHYLKMCFALEFGMIPNFILFRCCYHLTGH